MKAVKSERCNAVFGGLTWMPCTKPKGHNGLHHGEVSEPKRRGSIDWNVETKEPVEVKPRRKHEH